MNAWCHLPTIFGMRLFVYRRRRMLRFVGLFMICVAVITTLFVSISNQTNAAANKTISFQGRLLDSYGAAVPDAHYNIQFKIYQGGAGNTQNNPGGTLVWTETYINNGSPTGGVQLKNGSFTVNLGSKNPFADSVDWDHETLWLSMNVAGSSTSCTTFGSGTCAADGEMIPMKRMTATPYSMNAGAVGGKSASDLVQLGQGMQTDGRNGVSSISINKTGTGSLIQLQNSGSDVFTVTNTGDILFGNGNISIGGPNAESITIGSNSETANQDIIIGSGGSASGGSTTIRGKDSVAISTNGQERATFSGTDNSVTFGNGELSEAPNNFTIQGTNSSANEVDGGSLVIQGGDATVGDANGGNITIGGGAGSGTGTSGIVVIKNPTFQTASTQACDENCYISQSSIDNNGAISLEAETSGLTFEMNDPKITTAGKVMYVTTTANSLDFTLSINGGGQGNELILKPETTTTLFWNGSDWTVTGSPNSSSLTNEVIDDVESIRVGKDAGSTTLLTLDKSDSAPVITDEALLGSMYYDTTLGKLQCFEASGWGDCGSSPDVFVTLSPEYSNAVTNGSALGDFTSDICSSTLGINDGSSSQPEVCSEDETYNFYNWTSSEISEQTKSIYVNYQLPDSFKEFAENSMYLDGRTDSADSSVSYQVYRNSGEGLVSCGSSVTVSSGVQTTWQKTTFDPSSCSFNAGDRLVIKIDLSSSNDANAYVGNLGFVFSNR